MVEQEEAREEWTRHWYLKSRLNGQDNGDGSREHSSADVQTLTGDMQTLIDVNTQTLIVVNTQTLTGAGTPCVPCAQGSRGV